MLARERAAISPVIAATWLPVASPIAVIICIIRIDFSFKAHRNRSWLTTRCGTPAGSYSPFEESEKRMRASASVRLLRRTGPSQIHTLRTWRWVPRARISSLTHLRCKLPDRRAPNLTLPVAVSRRLLEQHPVHLDAAGQGPADHQGVEHSNQPARRRTSRVRRLTWIGPRRVARGSSCAFFIPTGASR